MEGTDSTPITPDWPAVLRDMMATYFSLAELEALCFDLGVDYEELGEGGKSHKIMALIREQSRRNGLVALIDKCAALRPHVDWGALRQAADQQPELFVLPEPEEGAGYRFVGDFRGATINIVGAAEARDLEGRPPEAGEPPYKGLQYYDEQDADHFYGREALTAKVVARLHGASFLAVIGASGSGKSSLVRAGILPALRRGQRLADGSLPPTNSGRWLIRVMTPTSHPLDALSAALAREGDTLAATAEVSASLAAGPQTLRSATRAMLAQGSSPRLLLVIDQFEEVFTLCRQQEERQAFIDNLVAAADPEEGLVITILLTLRADFYAQCAQYEGLRGLLSQHQEYIGAMSREELAQAIVQPAALGDWRIQEGLVEQMLDDVGDEPGALPLLSHALLETWARRRGRTMTLSAYRESGGVRGAIAQTAESIFQQRLSETQRPVARMIFMRLTELGEAEDGESPDTRRRVSFSELITRATDPVMLDAVLAILTEARLVTTDVLPPDEVKVVEVAHEALIREWPTLRGWLDQDRANLIYQRQLTADVNDWLKLDRDPGALYRGARLAQMLDRAGSFPEPLSLDEQEFLELSQQAAAEEEERQKRLERARRTQRVLIAVAAVLSLAVISVTVFFVFRPDAADCTPEKMSGQFNVALAEIAVLDAGGRLSNEDNSAGIELARRLERQLAQGFSDEAGIELWVDGESLLQKHCATVGVVADDLAEVESPAAAAERLDADVVVYGTLRPAAGNAGDGNAVDGMAVMEMKFYLAPQLGLDFGDKVGSYTLETPVPVFDISNPGPEVDTALGPQTEALARVARGFTRELLGRPQDALADFERAAELAPDSDFTHFFVGQEYLFLAQSESDLAEAYEQEAAEAFGRAPQNARAQIGLAAVSFVRAQRWLDEALAADFAGDVASRLGEVAAEAQQALALFSEVVTGGSQVEAYGVPVDQIARLGMGISQRLLGETAYYQADVQGAGGHIQAAIGTLETAVPALEAVNDHRLLGQVYQALGSTYEWRSFLLSEQGDTAASAEATESARSYYEACVQQGEEFPFDTYLVDEIVEKLCRPQLEQLPSR